MSAIRIEPATREALLAFRDAPMEFSGRAVMALDDAGIVMGVGGIYVVGNAYVAWVKFAPALRRRPFWIARHIDAVLGLARGRGLPILAECDRWIDGSERLLKFAGFRPTSAPGVWVLPENENGC